MYSMKYERIRSSERDGEIDYAELEAAARRIVHQLRANGVGGGRLCDGVNSISVLQ